MAGIIYFRTKYGSTEDYARWLSMEVGFELRNIKKGAKVGPEGIVIVGSSLMMGKVTAASWIKRNWDRMKGKKLVLFLVGGSKIGTKEREDIVSRSLPVDIIKDFKIFHLPGRIDHSKLNFLLSKIVRSAAKHEDDEVERRRWMEGYDDVERGNLRPIVEHIKGL